MSLDSLRRALPGLAALVLIGSQSAAAWGHEDHAHAPAATAPAVASAAAATPDLGKMWQAMAQKPQLAASAAFAPDGRLWLATVDGGRIVLRASSDQGRSFGPPITVNGEPEVIAADGENRPKLAFGPGGSLLVAWTRPLTKPFTGEIRFARAADGQTFSAPITVHRDRAEITHRFESLLADADGRVVVVWIDKRDGEAAKASRSAYRGAAIYSAVSRDGGLSFAPEKKVADHSCECCRIALTRDSDGAPLVLWRHVFAPNERDHAIARLRPDGTAEAVLRATQDRWRVDACPHHGPALAVDDQGNRHAVWFNQREGEGRVFYGRLPRQPDAAVSGQRPVGGPLAAHADLAVSGARVSLVWKEFDGEQTVLHGQVSTDRGGSFVSRRLAATRGKSDQPRLLQQGDSVLVLWRTEQEGIQILPLGPDAGR